MAEEEEEEQGEREEGETSTGDCNKYVGSNPLIRQQGGCSAIRFKWGVACGENIKPGTSLGEMSGGCKNII